MYTLNDSLVTVPSRIHKLLLYVYLNNISKENFCLVLDQMFPWVHQETNCVHLKLIGIWLPVSKNSFRQLMYSKYESEWWLEH